MGYERLQAEHRGGQPEVMPNNLEKSYSEANDSYYINGGTVVPDRRGNVRGKTI